jgi:hypothetical protein
MHRQSCPGTLRLLGVIFAVTMLVSPSVFGQPLRATVVHVEGATQTWRVTDKDGKIVEVHVPAQSLIDIQTSQEERPGASGAAEPVRGTVPATVVAVDTLTNRVKVQTQAGQVIELATATTDRQIGEQVTLIIPR